jgi:pimeloyl-ACP methyl ester carboxylesterase
VSSTTDPDGGGIGSAVTRSGEISIVLVHGAWHDGSCWAPVAARLTERGHDVRVVDLPSEQPGAAAREYTDVVVRAVRPLGPGHRVVLVGHSLGGLAVPVAAAALGPDRVAALVLVAALVPRPGHSWQQRAREAMVAGFGRGQVRHDDGTTSWPPDAAAAGLYAGVAAELAATEAAGAEPAGADPAATSGAATSGAATSGAAANGAAANGAAANGAAADRAAADRAAADRAPAVVDAAVSRLRRQGWAITRETTPLEAWPAVPTVRVICAADRVVDPGWSRSEAGAVPGAEVVELPGGHFPMLTRPDELVAVIEKAIARAADAADRPAGDEQRRGEQERGER